jgi:hypothetical protein
MRAAMKSQHCPSLTKEMREVLDDAALKYGTDWSVRSGKHFKIYLGDRMVSVVSLSKDRNNHAQVTPAARLRGQIERAMKC